MASRAILKTTISLGMISVPVRLVSAYDRVEGAAGLHLMHKGCGGGVGMPRTCKKCNQRVEPSEVGRGVSAVKDGPLIPVTDEELAALPVESARTIALEAFVDEAEITPAMRDTIYYLEPEPVGLMPFALLAQALTRRKRVGIGSVSIRTRERLCAIRPVGGTLILETLLYPNEIRPLPTPDNGGARLPKEMVEAAVQLIDLHTKPFDAGKHTDHYAEALNALIASKLSGQPATPAATGQAPDRKAPADLMAMLRASLEAAKAPAEQPAAPKRTRAKKAA